ncbi:hypothetical protein DICVIV_11423 [Dictyocaulus viviparus]|uniref:CX domain-containing protein n=1 Tax=Dictyocaulus viviparus TaxID=29172 RepID=A0A0D8XD67_DICVI|nr:hypothetical protein DICVIV_11423 [Dictyocaulus viviparus]
MEIALQEKSKGILYEGYTKSFRQCIFEEGDVVGKNERYEFRCDDDLECCGRTCCIPEAATIPLWLMILFIILAAVLLSAILGTLVWLMAKRKKEKPKKAGFLNDVPYPAKCGGYTALNSGRHGTGNRRGVNDSGLLVQEQDTYSTPDHLYGGYDGRSYNQNNRGFASRRDGGILGEDGEGNNNGTNKEIAIRDVYRNIPRQYAGDRSRGVANSHMTMSSDAGSLVRHGVHETVEKSFKQEITYERPVSTDSRDLL